MDDDTQQYYMDNGWIGSIAHIPKDISTRTKDATERTLPRQIHSVLVIDGLVISSLHEQNKK